MNAEDYEAMFQGLDLPEKIELFSGSVVSDVRLFIEKEINLLRHLRTERHQEAIRYRLDRLMEVMNENTTGNIS